MFLPNDQQLSEMKNLKAGDFRLLYMFALCAVCHNQRIFEKDKVTKAKK